jgi:hypothetical protein
MYVASLGVDMVTGFLRRLVCLAAGLLGSVTYTHRASCRRFACRDGQKAGCDKSAAGTSANGIRRQRRVHRLPPR